MATPKRRSWLTRVGTTLVTTAVVGYGAYKLADWVWNEHLSPKKTPEESSGKEHETAVSKNPERWKIRRQRLTRCRDETTMALEGFLGTLRDAIEARTSTTSETKLLKELRIQRDQLDPHIRKTQEEQLWNTIKIKSVTKMMVTAYAHTILFLVLTVQVNLLGGRLFEEQMRNDGETMASDRMTSYQQSHRFVLTHTYEYFFAQGLDSLLSTVESAVADILGPWNVMDRSALNISRETLDDAITRIRQVVEGRKGRSLMRFLMPPSANLDVPMNDALASSILDETWDLLESPVLMDAQKDCLNATFSHMKMAHWGNIFSGGADTPQRAATPWTTKPLAHVLTQLKTTTNSFYQKEENKNNPYCSQMEMLPSLLELGDVSFN